MRSSPISAVLAEAKGPRVARSSPISAVLAEAKGPRVVGMDNRTRNERVLARAGVRQLAVGALDALPPDAPLLAVRADLALNVAFFAELGEPGPEPRLYGPETGPFALFGRAGAVRPLLAEYFAGRALHEHAGLSAVAVPERSALSLATPALARLATGRLLKQAQKPTDGIVSRNLNRYISRFFTRIFFALGLTPNHASLVNLAIGLCCAYFAAQTGYFTMVLAGFLFQFASAFDGVDGEMARTTLGETPRGAWIDTAVDNVTYVACLLGISIGWAREGIGPGGLALAAALMVIVPGTLLLLMRFVQQYGPDGSLVFVDRCVERAAQDSGRATLRLARFLFHALRRDVFAVIFFLISLTGLRAAVPMTVAAGAAVALSTLLVHRTRLLAAAQALAVQRS